MVTLIERNRAAFGRLALVEEPLTRLPLTLHRLPQPAYRAAGLELCEEVYRLRLTGAKEAILLLDRSPAT